MYNYKAKVVKVIDGDTLDLCIDLGFNVQIKERVRLYGIDTPEIRTGDEVEKIRAHAAKQYVIDAVENKEILIYSLKGKGKYGRWLVDIMYDYNEETGEGKSLNSELVSKGYARIVDYD